MKFLQRLLRLFGTVTGPIGGAAGGPHPHPTDHFDAVPPANEPIPNADEESAPEDDP